MIDIIVLQSSDHIVDLAVGQHPGTAIEADTGDRPILPREAHWLETCMDADELSYPKSMALQPVAVLEGVGDSPPVDMIVIQDY